MGGCAQVLCKYYILYKELEQPQILVFAEILEQIPYGYQMMTV